MASRNPCVQMPTVSHSRPGDGSVRSALKSIVFVSCASPLLDSEALRGLLRQSRQSNRQHGITGVLLHSDGDIMQAIEGDLGTTDALFAKIRRDPRHTGVLVMHEALSSRRNFPGWPMGFGSAASTAPSIEAVNRVSTT